MKRYLFGPVIFVLIIAACTNQKEESQLVTTIYPFKAIIQELAGNDVQVISLLPSGADPHTYEMLPSDYKLIQNAKAFFYGAETLDGWAAKMESTNKIELLSLVPKAFLINIKVPHFDDDHDHSYGTDPHFWSDPLAVKAMLPALVEELVKVFPSKENNFRANEKTFSEKLDSLNLIISKQVNEIKFKTVFTSHPFYSYFFERYDFTVAGSLEVTPGYQATPKDLKKLISLVKKEGVRAIFFNKQHSDKTAKVLSESTGIKLYELDPIGGTEKTMTYNQIIDNNFSIIKSALK